jgi:2-polyprenyl-3-methyl-5-hydroxy-6-metoxy-1,4-benzoquinol methylase
MSTPDANERSSDVATVRDPAVDWHSRVADQFDAKYRHNRGFAERLEAWERLIAAYSGPAQRALDIGCGSGVLLLPLAARNATVLGLDGSEEMLALARRRLEAAGAGNVQLIRGDLAALPALALPPFDLIVASSVLEYVPDLAATLRAIKALLKPQGRFIFSLPNRSSLLRKVEPLAHRLVGRPRYLAYVHTVMTAREIASALQVEGLKVCDTRFCSPTWLLSPVFRAIGRQAWSDNLVLTVCAREPAGS